MYSGMTRNEVRGILALALVAALGVGARTYLSETPRRDVWVERPVKQAVALQTTPTPAAIVLATTPVPAPQATPFVQPTPVSIPQTVAQANAEEHTSQTVVLAPNLPNAQSVIIAPNAPQAQSISVPSAGTQAAPTAAPAIPPTSTALPVASTGTNRTKAAATPLAEKINLNTATLTDLDKLPGIGPKTAQKILDYRAQRGGFRSVDDLINVSGIGPKTLEKIRPSVRVN